eukprot:8910031-Lingulodinium_polyedra.AAC.1
MFGPPWLAASRLASQRVLLRSCPQTRVACDVCNGEIARPLGFGTRVLSGVSVDECRAAPPVCGVGRGLGGPWREGETFLPQ